MMSSGARRDRKLTAEGKEEKRFVTESSYSESAGDTGSSSGDSHEAASAEKELLKDVKKGVFLSGKEKKRLREASSDENENKKTKLTTPLMSQRDRSAGGSKRAVPASRYEKAEVRGGRLEGDEPPAFVAKRAIPKFRFEKPEVRAGRIITKSYEYKEDSEHRRQSSEEELSRMQKKGGVSKILQNSRGGMKMGEKISIRGRRGIDSGAEERKGKGARESSFSASKLKVHPKDWRTQHRHLKVEKGKIKSKSGVASTSRTNSNGANGGRREEKQQVREQIKQILLNAGWRIDLRPRRGRDYQDSVYVSPQGTGYWSITKAYAVFQEESKKDDVDNDSDDNDGCSASSDHDNAGMPLPGISISDLAMLKRKSREKKRSKDRLDKTEKRRRETVKRRKSKSSTTKHSNTSGLRNKSRCTIMVRDIRQDENSEMGDYVPYRWKCTVLSWLIDVGVISEHQKVKYMNKESDAILEGTIAREGICCGCCSVILSTRNFQRHAGCKDEKNLYENIILEDAGLSMRQCMQKAWEKDFGSGNRGYYEVDLTEDPNDDTCGICGDGGDLVCCDSCPSTFHLSCLGVSMPPPGDWCCMNCLCRFCGSVSCVSKDGESESSISQLLSCSHCGQKYHKACAADTKVDLAAVDSCPSETSFCQHACRKVYEQLQQFFGIKNKLEAGFSWSVVCRLQDDSDNTPSQLSRIAVCNSKNAIALRVMDECFMPMIDERSGINLIPNILYNYGSNISRLDYTGFSTFILEKSDEIISVASVRIHGTELAEMPFIGTRNMYRRQGMCRRLLDGIESALRALEVEKLVIPAIPELKETWTTIFGFEPVDASQKKQFQSINMLIFPYTGLLQKPLSTKHSVQNNRPCNTEEHPNSEPLRDDETLDCKHEVNGVDDTDVMNVDDITETEAFHDTPVEEKNKGSQVADEANVMNVAIMAKTKPSYDTAIEEKNLDNLVVTSETNAISVGDMTKKEPCDDTTVEVKIKGYHDSDEASKINMDDITKPEPYGNTSAEEKNNGNQVGDEANAMNVVRMRKTEICDDTPIEQKIKVEEIGYLRGIPSDSMMQNEVFGEPVCLGSNIVLDGSPNFHTTEHNHDSQVSIICNISSENGDIEPSAVASAIKESLPDVCPEGVDKMKHNEGDITSSQDNCGTIGECNLSSVDNYLAIQVSGSKSSEHHLDQKLSNGCNVQNATHPYESSIFPGAHDPCDAADVFQADKETDFNFGSLDENSTDMIEELLVNEASDIIAFIGDDAEKAA